MKTARVFAMKEEVRGGEKEREVMDGNDAGKERVEDMSFDSSEEVTAYARYPSMFAVTCCEWTAHLVATSPSRAGGEDRLG